MKYHLRKPVISFFSAAIGLVLGLASPVLAEEMPALTDGGPAFTDEGVQNENYFIISVENHYSTEGSDSVSGLTISGVDAPVAGQPLDGSAIVQTAEGVSWEIPVLWVDDTFMLATTAAEGRSYLPALAFFIPNGYAVNSVESFEAALSADLHALFGSNEIITVYDAATGILYILPANIRNFFVQPEPQPEPQPVPYRDELDDGFEELIDPADGYSPEQQSLVDIYCAQTARDALSLEDLEYVLDLIINKLEPQAVNLLLDSFPAFRSAADSGQIGREIGLYVYYEKGDMDGNPAHENTPEETLLHVSGMPCPDGDSQYFGCYIGVNLDSLSKRDESGNLIIHNGKRCIIREGEAVSDLENTMVQEMFRAVMYDYNRAGMLGFADSNDYTADYKNLTPEQENKIKAIQYPAWFIEGAASMVRNTYQSKTDLFNSLLENRRMPSDEESVEYGYLAVLYLSELAARSDPETGSAMTVNEDGTMSFSSQKICSGLNSILERMHDGETLDEVIHSVAPKDKDGVTVYSGTDDFAKKFFCGSMMDNGSSETASSETASSETDDGESLAFVTDFLSYMHDISEDTGRQSIANGSVLFDFEEDFETPLDGNKEETSEEYKIIESNTYVESTVPDSVALNTGGKSDRNGQTESAGPVEEAGDHSGAGTDPADAEIAAVEPEEVFSGTETLPSEPEAETVDVE